MTASVVGTFQVLTGLTINI